jgi:hypothetical protein
VTQFVVEVFTPRASAGELATAERRMMVAARRLSDADVSCLRALYLLDDEICFFVFDAPSGRDAALVAQHAGLEPIRVVEAILSRKEEK